MGGSRNDSGGCGFTVFAIDGDAAFRASLCAAVESAGYPVAPFGTAEEFLASWDGRRHGCVVLEDELPGLRGLGLQGELTRRHAGLAVLFVTARSDVPMVVAAVKAGAHDVLTKPLNAGVLLARLAELAALEAQHQRTVDETRARLAAVTPREREVLTLVVEGLQNKAIAERLGISYRTVEVHRGHLAQKLHTTNLLELVRLVDTARREQLLGA